MELDVGKLAARHEGASGILAHLLTDESILYTKTRNYYRTAVGHDLKELPELFESQCTQLEEMIHAVVERIRPLQGIVPRILAKFLEHPQLDAQDQEDVNARTMIANLLAGHKAIMRSLRVDLEAISDGLRGTEFDEFLKGQLEEHQVAVWMLCSLMEERWGFIGSASGIPEVSDRARSVRQPSPDA